MHASFDCNHRIQNTFKINENNSECYFQNQKWNLNLKVTIGLSFYCFYVGLDIRSQEWILFFFCCLKNQITKSTYYKIIKHSLVNKRWCKNRATHLPFVDFCINIEYIVRRSKVDLVLILPWKITATIFSSHFEENTNIL